MARVADPRKDSGEARKNVAQVKHGAYTIRRLLRRARPLSDSDRKYLHDQRLAWVVSWGFPTWESAPRQVQEWADIIIELALVRRLLVSPVWRGRPVPRRYDGITALQRLYLAPLIAQPTSAPVDVARLLAEMRTEKERGR